nr:hypothetical protein [Cupriavidus gilardii]
MDLASSSWPLKCSNRQPQISRGHCPGAVTLRPARMKPG